MQEQNNSTPATRPTTDFTFYGLEGLPIPNLEIRVTVGGEEYTHHTDSQGRLPQLVTQPDLPLKLEVKRFDGSYKTIDECRTTSSNACWSYTSPSVLLEAVTQLHEGPAGDIAQVIPRFEPQDRGVLQTPAAAHDAQTEAQIETKTEAEAQTEAQATAEPPPSEEPRPEPPVNPRYREEGHKESPTQRQPSVSDKYRQEGHNHPTPVAVDDSVMGKLKRLAWLPDYARALGPKVGANAPLASGRDANGNPMVVYTEKVKDWWGSWHLWGSGNAPAASAASGKAAADALGSAQHKEMAAKVQALIDFATEQTEYRYTEGTAGVLASMKNGKFNHKKNEKFTYLSIGLCYTYVKVALSRVNIIDGTLAADMGSDVQEQARLAGAALLKKGFTDVTNEVPDARWAAAGDVIVYAWTPETWAARRRSKGNPNIANYGHIDIRSITGYISDFIPSREKMGFGSPGWKNYENIRIYRKIFDFLPTLRIKAFLRCLREYECQAEPDDSKRYQMLNTAIPSNPSVRRFNSFKTHPWDGISIPESIKKGQGSTASGAYQITYPTWKEKFTQNIMQLPDGADMFSPAVQERIAVMKIEDRNVLHLIRKGEIERAVTEKTETGYLYQEWSSLPGGVGNAHRRTANNDPMNMAYLLKIFNIYLNEEMRKAGL